MTKDASREPASPNTHDAIPPGGDDNCRLKNLPPEIRNNIFELAVVEDTPITLDVPQYSNHNRIKLTPGSLVEPLTGLSLSSTCRQFRQEVTQVFYAQNTFSLEVELLESRSTRNALEFPIAKTTSFILKALVQYAPDDWSSLGEHIESIMFIEPKLHVEKLADKTLSIKASEFGIDDPCLCIVTKLAESCRGNDCLVTFVKEFQRRDLWDVLCKDPDDRVCKICGKV